MGTSGARSSPGRRPTAPTSSDAPSPEPAVLRGPVAICIDRPTLSLDRPFTYDLNEDLEAGLGSLVEVVFHGRRAKGWVLGPTGDLPPRVLPVRKVLSHVRFFDDAMLEVLRWVSERYVAPLASVITRAVPPRVVTEEQGQAVGGGAVTARAGRGLPRQRDHLVAGRDRPAGGFPDVLASYSDGRRLLGAMASGGGEFVVRPAPEDEVAVAVEAVEAALDAGRQAVLLVPEANPLPATARAVVETFERRTALLLGGSKRSRYRTWLEILGGHVDVVVGTRPAVFAPLRDLGLVFVSRESHPGHREERSPYYHVRDVALARARLQGAACVLSAVFPSVEASAVGATVVAPTERRWPPVEVVRPGPEGRAPRLLSALRRAERGFLHAPLPGYGVAQVCRSCGEPAGCAACRGLLRVRGGQVRCVVCGAEGRCAVCGAADFGIRRGGAERVEEWAQRAASVPVRRADAAIAGFPRKGVLVGGPAAVNDLGPVGLDIVGILDADLAARRPGLSALERSLATWAEATGWARPSGRAIVQTTRPNDPAVQALVAGRPDRFHRAESRRRAEAGFPVGAPVFRVAGSPELPDALATLSPPTLLVSEAEGETVCLLTLDPGRIGEFGRLARDLATRGAVTRVEAEPHL